MTLQIAFQGIPKVAQGKKIIQAAKEDIAGYVSHSAPLGNITPTTDKVNKAAVESYKDTRKVITGIQDEISKNKADADKIANAYRAAHGIQTP